jgi:hypothetical protein
MGFWKLCGCGVVECLGSGCEGTVFFLGNDGEHGEHQHIICDIIYKASSLHSAMTSLQAHIA